jgi:hypothetical protein
MKRVSNYLDLESKQTWTKEWLGLCERLMAKSYRLY